MKTTLWIFILAAVVITVQGRYYSSLEDIQLIREYMQERDDRPTDHAKVARELVHKSDWAAVGTISVDSKIPGFPMVNVISIADNENGTIYFMLVDLDFTGQDWHKNNNVTFLFTQDVNGDCRNKKRDPMEPTCARAMISGKVDPVDENKRPEEHKKNLALFVKKHPAARKWIESHNFYLCKLDIENIYVLDFYGGPNDVSVKDYYNVVLKEDEPDEILFKFPSRNTNKRYKITMEI